MFEYQKTFMQKRLVVLLFYLFPVLHFAQDYSALWEGHFSYYNIKQVISGNNKIFAAADNAIFSFDTQTNEIEELTTINGLSGETISTIYYSELHELLVIGYQNGLIEIAFDNNDDILTIVDIIDKPTIPARNKRINHINGLDDMIYISTNYGISVFDLKRLEFGDTYFIGNSGSQIQVNQTTIYGDYIYAALAGGFTGIKKADIRSTNLIDYKNWEPVRRGKFLAVESVGDKLYVGSSRRVYQVENDRLTKFEDAATLLEIKSVNNHLVVTTKNDVFIYDSNFKEISQVSVDDLFNSDSFNTEFTSATLDSEYLYIGTKDFGVLRTSIENPIGDFEEIHPKGPLLNIPFSINAEYGSLWVTFGEYNLFYVPDLTNRGFSCFFENEWINTPYSEVFDAKSLNSIAVNPFNNNQVFISSFSSGLLEVNENIPTTLYDQNNSGLEESFPMDIRVGPSLFDSNGLLWTITSVNDRPLKSYNPTNKQWKRYDFTSVIKGRNLGFGDLVIGADHTKWVASYEHGFIGFKENEGNPLLKKIYKDEENMPDDFVTALAVDKTEQLWIGTFRGLRVLYNTSNFFTEENVKVDEIIILENGEAKELLFQQHVSDIEVDGANNKWIGTVDSGLFYFSSDGQKTIFHFTKDNSALPSNTINDISLDDSNGVVYIATSRGLVSFNSGGSSPNEDLLSIFAYPNPVRPSFDIVEQKVKIKGVTENVNIKITDVEGNLVAEAQSRTNLRYRGYNLEIDGGIAYWNGKNLANNVVASGVYLVMLSDLDTFETSVLKLMVVR